MKEPTTVCGIDVHKVFLQVCILSRSGETSQHRFHNTPNGILALKDLVLAEGCEIVAMESTGIYWYRLFLELESDIRTIVANARQIKSIPGRKTDMNDARWIAELALHGLIRPSRIFPRRDREFRDLTRNRETLVRTRTTIKNRIHKILDSAGIRLNLVLKDLFGKSGRHLLMGLAEQKDLETTLATIPSPLILRRADQLREILQGSPLSPIQVQLLTTQLHLLDEIAHLDELILASLEDPQLEAVAICTSVPGISITAATTILAELGDVRDFSTASRLVSWAGLAPSVYQSADTLVCGKITKQGSKSLRWILVQAAQAASRTTNTVFSSFFRRIAYRRGRNKAIVALARKILSILWHLLVNREHYVEPGLKRMRKLPVRMTLPKISIDDAVETLLSAGYRIYSPENQKSTGKGVRAERATRPL
ncbi:IS110 family transposase [Methanoculleus sp.]|uniref:IS110 family transposase n=1 Tax=Methanoculleus sp. TaxID=90427 RepID=UPI002615BB2C|nr:IS110 family transposase [Methanoculleus sp.]MDI6867250.1 IS110 family transposase [Methanoculleus sp.]